MQSMAFYVLICVRLRKSYGKMCSRHLLPYIRWIGFARVALLLRDLIGSFGDLSLFLIIWLWKDVDYYKVLV